MILINKKQVKLTEIDKILGIKMPLELIKKKPLFEINPALMVKDPANGPGAVKLRYGMEFPCVFYAILPSGENMEIRYCTSRTPDVKFMGQSEKYAPKAVEFEGKAEFIKDDLDKAVFFWLHFYNKTSPFRQQDKPYEYELVDDDARATTLINQITLRSRATSHAAALEGQQMIIIAKGMKIQGVSTMEPLMVKAQLMQRASDNPAEYLNAADSQVNHIQGLIIDSIDKGIFVLENQFNSKRWKWGMGVKRGEFIVEMSSSVTDETDALLTHISQHIQEFLPVLIDTSKTINAKANLVKELENVDVMGALFDNVADEGLSAESENGEEDDLLAGNEQLLPLPTSYAEAQEYLGKHISKKTPALASALIKGIESGEVTVENIDLILEEYKTK